MKGHIFLACELLGFRHCALDAIGDEVKLRLVLFHGFSGLRLQDNHRSVGSRAIRKDPPILTVNLLEASAPHDHCAGLAQRIARDFIETVEQMTRLNRDLTLGIHGLLKVAQPFVIASFRQEHERMLLALKRYVEKGT
jgi:hypothetical protein